MTEASATALPEALAGRAEIVTLSDGSTVVIEDWSWSKLQALWKLVGQLEKVQELVELSVRPGDRPRMATLSADDVGRLALVINRRNLPAIKNLIALADQWGQVAGATRPASTP